MELIQASNEQDLFKALQIIEERALWCEEKGFPLWDKTQISIDALKKNYPDKSLFFARLNNQIIGCIFLLEQDDIYWPDINYSNCLFFHKLTVATKYKGLGYGKKILEAVKTYAINKKYNWLRLDCRAERQPLRDFYESCGFKLHSVKQIGRFLSARYEIKIEDLYK